MEATLSPDWQEQRLLAELDYYRALQRANESYADALQGLVNEQAQQDGGVVSSGGPVQRRILRLPELGLQLGLTAPEIAKAISYDEANVYAVLKTLAKQGSIEVVEGSSPQRWRLSLKLRRSKILRVSRLIERGEWTTYGEFGIAVYGNWRTAVVIGNQARLNAAFANPHRVLATSTGAHKGGFVAKEWQDDEGRGPDEAARLLADEGVPVSQDADGIWRVDPEKAHFVDWETLQQRMASTDQQDN